jgi:hypothetical protein
MYSGFEEAQPHNNAIKPKSAPIFIAISSANPLQSPSILRDRALGLFSFWRAS